MIQYILECIAFQLVFLIIYDFFLKKETFFQWNRAYLIGTYALSMALPWIKIEALKTTVPQEYYAYPEFLWNTNGTSPTVTASEGPILTISLEEGIVYGGMLLATFYFGYKLYQIQKLRKDGSIQYFPNFTQIVVKNSELAFSFFKSIFLGDKVVQREHESIIKHELVHIEQKHSWDLLFFEFMRIVGWFNPLVYVYQSRISELHEFIADAMVTKTHKSEQYQFLLSQVFQTENISFVNQFFKSSLIKKRIVMLQKAKSKNVWQLKYLLLVPLVLGMLFYTSSEAQAKDEVVQEQTTEDAELIAEINAKIDREIEEQGSISKVYFSFSKEFSYLTEDYLLSKEAYFKRGLMSQRHFDHYSDSLVKAKTPFFRKESFPKRRLPSTTRYKSYVQHAKAFQVLDKNLKGSIQNNFQTGGSSVRLLDENESFPIGFDVFEVTDVMDLTGVEVLAFNHKIDQIFKQNDSSEKGLILTDGKYDFEIFESKIEDSIWQKQIKQEPEIIEVKDVENLTKKEEKKIFERLKNLSSSSEDWILKVKDKNSIITFSEAADGSSISGPDGLFLKTKMFIESRILDENFSLFDRKSKEKRGAIDENSSSNDLSAKYQELVMERSRLLKNASEDNPIIKNLDEQLGALKQQILANHGGTVAFSWVEEPPVFPGCENAEDPRECFQKSMQKHIVKNFRYPQEAQEKGIQGRVSVMFTMDAEGNITNIRKRGPDKSLEDEAVRIISLLPKIKPGIQGGEKVNVPFSIPITFRLQGKGWQPDLNKLADMTENIPYLIVDGKVSTKEKVMEMNQEDVEAIYVLKGEAAIKKYGEVAKNGVVEITMKKNTFKGMSVSAKAENKGAGKRIYGTVTDGAKLPLPGATISIDGSAKGVITDFDGSFSINAKKGDVIVIQYIGLPVIRFTITDESEYQINKK